MLRFKRRHSGSDYTALPVSLLEEPNVPESSPATVEHVARLCRVCNAHCQMMPYQLQELNFRTLESFSYLLCSDCGSMQIEEIPLDLRRFYPKTYYSLGKRRGPKLVHWIRSQGLRFCVGERNLTGRLLAMLRRLPSDSVWIRACRPQMNWRILDVGCGTGDRLYELALAGFTRLQGVEPFIEADIRVANGVTITKGTLDSLNAEFDFIMMHHSLEHVDDPRSTIMQVCRLLAEDGKVLLRVPVMGKHAWRRYGVDWAQLDAPRHLHDFTEKGVSALAESAGFHVESVIYDSFEFQFEGSEAARHFRTGHEGRLN